MADTKENVVDLQPGNLPTLKRGEKVGKELQMYGAMILPETFGQVVEYAQMMAKGGLAIPKHMREQPGVCMAVIQRSLSWQMDPWAVATKTYAVNDILAYEAQLVAAVVKKWAPVKEKVWNPIYSGEGQSRKVSFKLHHRDTGEEITYETPAFALINPKNSPLWKSDPDQQQFYYAIRACSRRHWPEILLGVYDREEAYAMRDITPKRDNKLYDEPPKEEIEEAIGPVDDLQQEVQQDIADARDALDEILDPKTGEIDEEKVTTLEQAMEENQVPPKEPEPEELTEAVILRNMLKSIQRTESNAALAEYKRLTADDVKKMSADARKKIRAAFFEKEGTFDEL